MAVRPERVKLQHPDELKPREKNIVTLNRVDDISVGRLAYFNFGPLEWCAFVPADRMIYPGLQVGVFVAEDDWYFVDDEGKILLDL